MQQIIVGVVVVVVIVVGLAAMRWAGASEVNILGQKLTRFGSSDELTKAKAEVEKVRAERDTLALVLRHYSEVAEALSGVVAPDSDAEASAQRWAVELATRLAQCLKTKAGEQFRTAIWLLDPEHSDRFVAIALGQGAFTPDEPQQLTRKGTLAGLAFDSDDHSYNCRDTGTDPNYKRLSTGKLKYRSVYCQTLGEPKWGVLTVDAVEPDAFHEPQIETVQRFAGLAALGMGTWFATIAHKGTPTPDE